MESYKNSILKDVKYFWMFLTEKCNLDCVYCFYKFRDLKETLSLDKLKIAIDSLPPESKAEFVISGGEPFIEWDLVKDIMHYVKQKFPNNYRLIQTNGILVTPEKFSFLKKYDINLEFGFDGLLPSNRHRRGINTKIQQRIHQNITECVNAGIPVSCTMVVHPEESKDIIENMAYLVNIGLEKIEVTPAAFENWKDDHFKEFKKNYIRLCKSYRQHMVGDYDAPTPTYIDMVINAFGYILPNWCWLSLPDKKKFSYGKITNSQIEINQNALGMINPGRFQGLTYRERSTILSQYVYNELRIPQQFENYRKLNEFLKEINQRFILKYSNEKYAENIIEM